MERILIVYPAKEWVDAALAFLQGRKVDTLTKYTAALDHLEKHPPYDAVCCGWDKKYTIPIFAKAVELSSRTRCIAIGSSEPDHLEWVEECGEAWKSHPVLGAKQGPTEPRWLPDPLTSHAIYDLFPPTPERLVGELTANAAANDRPVLIEGEPGTGKKTRAQEIHEGSKRAGAPCKVFHCDAGTAQEQLLGALQPGTSTCPTLTVSSLELAEGGTLILAGVEHLQRPAQLALLELLEDPAMTFVRPGSRNRVSADVRIMATANCWLRPLLDDLFDGDLFYRLSSNYIRLPALRERRAEVERLARELLDRLRPEPAKALATQSAPLQSTTPPAGHFSPDVLRVLNLYPWPGNLRELKFVMQYAALRSSAREQIDVAHLPPWLVNAAGRAEL